MKGMATVRPYGKETVLALVWPAVAQWGSIQPLFFQTGHSNMIPFAISLPSLPEKRLCFPHSELFLLLSLAICCSPPFTDIFPNRLSGSIKHLSFSISITQSISTATLPARGCGAYHAPPVVLQTRSTVTEPTLQVTARAVQHDLLYGFLSSVHRGQSGKPLSATPRNSANLPAGVQGGKDDA